MVLKCRGGEVEMLMPGIAEVVGRMEGADLQKVDLVMGESVSTAWMGVI